MWRLLLLTPLALCASAAATAASAGGLTFCEDLLAEGRNVEAATCYDAWALRDDDSSAYLDESRPIGSQIGPSSRVTITPQTHLGGAELAGR